MKRTMKNAGAWFIAVAYCGALMAVTGCSARPHKARIVAVYEEDVDANDGQVQKEWRTTIHLENDGRMILPGQYGATGDVFTAFFTPGEGWGCNP